MNAISKDLQQASLNRDSLLLEDLQEQYKDVQDQVIKEELEHTSYCVFQVKLKTLLKLMQQLKRLRV